LRNRRAVRLAVGAVGTTLARAKDSQAHDRMELEQADMPHNLTRCATSPIIAYLEPRPEPVECVTVIPNVSSAAPERDAIAFCAINHLLRGRLPAIRPRPTISIPRQRVRLPSVNARGHGHRGRRRPRLGADNWRRSSHRQYDRCSGTPAPAPRARRRSLAHPGFRGNAHRRRIRSRECAAVAPPNRSRAEPPADRPAVSEPPRSVARAGPVPMAWRTVVDQPRLAHV
jgi:hypothetical protein